MKRMGVLGGMSPQATIDFEARVHAVSQRLMPQHWNSGSPPMVVWYHRHLPARMADDGRPISPMQADPRLLEAAVQLGQWADFLVIPCNSAHIARQAIEEAAGRPVLSMIDVTLDAVARRRWEKVGVLGFNGASPLYLAPLQQRGIACETIARDVQLRLDGAIQRVMEGCDGPAETEMAREAIEMLRARGVDGILLGCTEIPLLLGEDDAGNFVNPADVLAEAAVRFAMEETA